jgi:uncharacterized protein (TIGR02246 family)
MPLPDVHPAADPHGESSPEATEAVAAVLDRSMRAWNAGDLPGFLDCYEPSEETSYLTGDCIVIGHADIARHYTERFSRVPGPGRGLLNQSLTRVLRLGTDLCLAIGRYSLSGDAADPGSSGVFSLVLRNTLCGWRIIADHTSARV